MREPFSSPILGAEDPYLHMVKAWDLVQGRGLPAGYPPGFVLLLAPFTLLGDAGFYAVARFLPPLFGVVQVLGVYLLCRENLRTPAALVAALIVALMPENIFRTSLLFPTALDLAVLPFAFLFLVRASHGDRRALAWFAIILVALVFIHPWVVALLLAPALVAAVLAMRAKRDRALLLASLGVLGALALVLAFLPGAWNPTPSFLQNAGPRLWELVRDPASLFPLPLHVNLPAMLAVPVLWLAAVGAAAAIVRRNRLGVLALAWSAFILPFVFVDWFDIWFIPHRSVAYLSFSFAILAALPIELMSGIPDWEHADKAVAPVVAAMLLFGLTPIAFAVEPWYRLYDEDDYRAWEALESRGVPLVVTGSWQAAVGYRAITGEDSVYNPAFFESREVREDHLRTKPGLVVLVEPHARENGVDTGFLGGWREVGRWGDAIAYQPR